MTVFDFTRFRPMEVYDCHVHFRLREKDSGELESLTSKYTEAFEKARLSQIYMSAGNLGLYLKALDPSRYYIGLEIPSPKKKPDWYRFIESALESGFDGVGEMGSKPAPRAVRVPLDSPLFEGLWSSCEELGFPILCHVADPEEFWSEDTCPEWAKKRGWGPYGADYPTKEELYEEMENVLDMHPRVKVILAHMYFMTADLERADEFLKSYGNVYLDLALGIELMYNISRRRDDWRDFFIKHRDRIVFGTDIMPWQSVEEAVTRVWMIRMFLETDEEFYTPTSADELLTRYKEPFIGLDLPEEVLDKIYRGNFIRIFGREPKSLDVSKARRFLEEQEDDFALKVFEEALKSKR